MPLAGPLEEDSKTLIDGMYDAEVATQDEHIGLFFRRLQASGRLDNTLVIVCADHGEHLGEKQFLGHSQTVYNELVHVPLLIRDPDNKFVRGATIDTPVSTRRIFHTILSAVGAADSEEEKLSLENSIDDVNPEDVFAEAIPISTVIEMMRKRRPALIAERRCESVRRAVVRDNYKLIQTGSQDIELFHIKNDPKEQLELQSIFPEEAETLQNALHDYVHNSTIHAAARPVTVSNDPEVNRRLRDLGYLE